jgi:hypothetical protein
LQEAEELHLDAKGKTIHIVKKNSPFICLLDEAKLPRMRAGKRALLMTEQFVLSQFCRHGTAMNGHKWLVGLRAEVMNRPSDQLFSSTGLT